MPTEAEIDTIRAFLDSQGEREMADAIKALYQRAMKARAQNFAFTLALQRPININIYHDEDQVIVRETKDESQI